MRAEYWDKAKLKQGGGVTEHGSGYLPIIHSGLIHSGPIHSGSIHSGHIHSGLGTGSACCN